MAKLKIPKNVPVSSTHPDGFDHSTPNEQGYVNVVEKLILDDQKYNDFLGANHNRRAQKLQDAAGLDENGLTCFVFHELTDGTKEKITDAKCSIKVEVDKKKNPNSGAPSKFTIALPEDIPDNFDYLNKYAEIIHNLYAQNTTASKKRAHNFMFGMMLLTRCR